ncbi:hypothetical protein Vretimale_12949 [Volvox reticuliferus]|nr:hypothetical protein Vretimale_12949 [Volvox reticuliferus]
MAAGPGVTGIEGWRVALLLVGFIIVTLSFEGLINYVEKRLKKRKGLLTAFRALKNELLYLGFLSLLLSVTQEYLARICIPHTHGSSYDKYKKKYNLADNCAEGKEPLWPVSVQHETHYFIFAVAVTHILYCALTIALTLRKVATWRPWEDAALKESKSSSGDVKVMQETVSRSLIRSMCTSALAAMSGHRSPLELVAHLKAVVTSLAAQFRVSVSQPMYHNVRLLFIEKMGLTYDFDFHALVTNGMENQLAHAVHASWPLWMIATLFLVLPTPSYVPFWSYCLVMLMMFVVGAKLVSITALLGMQVAIKYGDSVLFGRMDMEPRALVRTGPARRRMSLSQLADSLGDAIDNAATDGIFTADGGGSGEGGGTSNAAGGEGAAATGAHVLDEALPPGAGAEVQAQVAAIAALTSREEALNLLRTMASKPLLPEHPSTQQEHQTSNDALEPSLQLNAAAAVSTATARAADGVGADANPEASPVPAITIPGGDVPSAASTSTLLPSPSLLLGIAPPRWGPRPAAPPLLLPAPMHQHQQHHPPHKKKKSLPPPPVRLPVPTPTTPPADITPLSPVLNSVVGTPASVSAFSVISSTSALAPPSSASPAKPLQGGVGGDVTITVMGSDEAPTAAPSAAADPRPSTDGASGLGGIDQLAASVRPPAIRPPTAGLERPISAARPSTAVGSQPPLSVLLPTPRVTQSPGTAIVPPFAATMRTSSRGLNAAVAAASWANATTRRNTSRPSAGLMLCGVATSRARTALEQMEEAMAIAATAVEMSAGQHQELVAPPASTSAAGGGGGGGGEIRPLTPPATPGGGVAGFLASLRPSRVARVTEDSRTLLDGSPSTEPVDVGIRSPRVTMRHISRMAMTLTRIAGQIASPAPTTTGTGVGGAAGNDVAAAVPADAHVIDPIAAAAIAAKAAATLICQLSPRRPIRRCMSARQLMCTTHIGEEDFSRTLVRRQPAAANNATIANCGVCAPNGKAVVLRPGGVQDDSSIGLQAGLAGADLLPAPRFGAPKAAAVAASASPDLHPSIPHLPKFPKLSAAALPISFFGPRKKAKKSHRQSGGAAEGTGDKASGDGGGGDGEDCAGKAADVSAPLQAAERSSSPERQELVSVTGVAAELSGSSMAESPAAAAKDAAAAEASRPESGGKPGVQAPQSRGGAVASAFALFQVKVQQSPGGNDESAAYDSLSALLPPPMPMSPGSMASMIPGFVRGTGSSDRANFDQSTVSDHPGSSSAAAPIAGNSAAYDPTATNTHRTRMEPAVSAHAVTSAEVGGGGGGGDDGGAAAASAAALPAAVASSDSIPFPSPPELSLSPEVSRPRSGLRIVRVGDNGPWISVQEAVALAMGTSGLDSMESGVEATAAGAASATATSAAPWRYGEESEYENGFGYEDESGASAPQHGTRLLLPNTSGFREAALLERPLPRRDRGVGGAGGQGASTLPPRVLASVFSMNTSASSESASDIPVPPPCPSQQDSTAGELESRSYASVGAGGGGIRTAASMGGSGDLSGVDVDVEPCKECGDELDVDGYYGLVASAGGDELTYGGGDSPFADDPARHRLAAAAAAAAGAAERAPSSRAEADLPSTPGATGLPMIPHSLETVEEGDEEAAEAEMVEAETEAYRKSRRGSDAAASACGITEGNVIGKVSEGDQEMGSVRLSQPLLPPPRPLSAGVIVGDGNDSDSVRYDTREDSLGGGGSGAAATWSRERPEQAPLEDPSDGYPTGDPEPELESTFTGFGIVKLNRTAPRIGMGTALRDLPTPPRMPARMVGSLRSESRMQPSGSSVSLMSLAPWVGDEGFGPEGGSAGGGGSEFASRAPSEAADGQSRCSASGGDSRPESAAMVAEENGEARKDSRLGRNVRSVFGSAASQDDEEDGDGEAEEMPPPPPPPAAPPAAPPPPSHQRSGPMLIAGGSGSGDGDGAAVSVADGSRWAVAVPPSLRSGPTRGVAVHNIISATTIYGSVRTCVHPAGGNGGGDHIGMLHGHVGGICNWDDPWAGPVCEGSGTLAEGSNGLKTAEIPPSLSPLPALPPPDSTANGATSVSPFGEESLRTTAAGIAAGHIWRDRAKEHDEEHRTGGGGGGPIWHGQNSHSSLLALLGAHHSRNSGRQHNHCHHHHNHHNHLGHGSDSESDDGGCCHTIWPPCIPKPWHHPRVVPLPAPVRDLKDNLAAGVDKAKVALTNAAGDVADTVKEKLRYGSRSTSKQQPHQQLQRKISDHWLERVRNMLAAHKGFEVSSPMYMYLYKYIVSVRVCLIINLHAQHYVCFSRCKFVCAVCSL